MISIGISYPFLFFSLILGPCKVVDIKISFLKIVKKAESKISVVNSETNQLLYSLFCKI